MTVRGVALLAGVGAPVPVPPEVSDALNQIDITSAVGERSSLRLQFSHAPGSQLPTPFVPSAGNLTRIVLVAGDGDARSVVMDGVAAEHIISVGDQHTGPTLVIGGGDLTLLMDLIDRTGRPFPAGMPREARVALILAAYTVHGMVPFVVPAPVGTNVPPPGVPSLQRGTDYAYVRSLAAEVGYRFSLDPGPAPGSPVAFWGPERGPGPLPARVIDFARLGPDEALRLRVNPTRPSGSAAAKAGEGTLAVGQGQQPLRAGATVEIQGAGGPFNGLYTVTRVHHTITAGSYRQEFELAGQ